jgi:hypothetical protein
VAAFRKIALFAARAQLGNIALNRNAFTMLLTWDALRQLWGHRQG